MGIRGHQITEVLSQWADNGAWGMWILEKHMRRFCKRWSMLGRLTMSPAVLHQDSADPFVGTKEASVP